jgi:hypothetical protein
LSSRRRRRRRTQRSQLRRSLPRARQQRKLRMGRKLTSSILRPEIRKRKRMKLRTTTKSLPAAIPTASRSSPLSHRLQLPEVPGSSSNRILLSNHHLGVPLGATQSVRSRRRSQLPLPSQPGHPPVTQPRRQASPRLPL